MFGKVKQWLGIEGVKLDLFLEEDPDLSNGQINGTVRLYSQNEQKVNFIKIKMVERFARGRRGNKRIDEYELGSLTIDKSFDVPAEQPIELDFTLTFELAQSDMDRLEEKNFVLKSLVQAAKALRGVESEYRIEAEADVKGTALNPFDKKIILS